MTSDTEPLIEPARFRLRRIRDISGVSGTGVVAFGTWYPNRLITVAWQSDIPTTTMFTTMDDVLAVHGHGGCTVVEWIDKEPEPVARARRTHA